ncbi:MAG: methyl-accepting chemotaxis protein [Desulfuromonas sp.]|nr:methyl-accepting chemotaxis protein [Desulfuromonas sp.]
MSIKYKQMIIVMVSVALPLILTMLLIVFFSAHTRTIIDEQTALLVDADLDHTFAGTVDLIDLYQASKKQQRSTAVKSYLRSYADELYSQVEQSYKNSPSNEISDSIRKAVLAPRIGKSGYAFGMNSAGRLTIHPKSEGRDLSGAEHIDRMRSKKEGFIVYHSVTAKRDKAVYYRYFAPLDLIIAPGVFIDELETLYDHEGEAASWAKLLQRMQTLKIGAGGYFWAIDAGDSKGEYKISPNGNKDGQNGWSLRDENGVAYIQQLIESAKSATGGTIEDVFVFKNSRSAAPERMLVRAIYYAPLDWVLGISIPVAQIETASKMADESFKNMMFQVGAAAAIFLVLGAIFAYWNGKKTVEPIKQVMLLAKEIEGGRLGRRFNLTRNDELGEMARIMDELTDSLENEIVGSLQRLADGDLTCDVQPRDDQDQLRTALHKLNLDLNDIVGQIQGAGGQINSASGQIADASQTLSQGATQSAAALEEISSSMIEMTAQTTQNAENADQANQLSVTTSSAVEKGGQQMNGMVAAMAEINEAGQNISKIIKVIDEIAFQTNLLALNAAVEAARAGQHGKGFAVVAEEVRNLAARSAKAAQETAELIEGSVKKTMNGTQIAEETSSALQEIVGSITKVTALVADIAVASNEQAQGITQMTQALGQVDQSVQRNTATAEESAAAEELSSQAEQLKHMLSRFKLANSQALPPVTPEL